MPVPTSNYTDLDIRAGVIEGGGSVPSQFNFEDLVNAADWSKFHPSYLDGATSKSGIVHEGQFRGYPYFTCPDPIYTITYRSHAASPFFTIDYDINISNAAGRTYNIGFNSDISSVSIYGDDGNGNIWIRKKMAATATVIINFSPAGSCGYSNNVEQTITPLQGIIGIGGLMAPNIATNKYCVTGPGDNATLTGAAPGGGTVYWRDDQAGGSILGGAGSWYAWAVSAAGASYPSSTINIGIC